MERVRLRSCVRRGAAIDLVLDRGRENRSQIVFTKARGRDAVFWQSPRTRKQARPNVRTPTARAAGVVELEPVPCRGVPVADTESPSVRRLAPLLRATATELDAAPGAPEPSTAEVRAWARDCGYAVPDRGRLRPEIWDAWRAEERR